MIEYWHVIAVLVGVACDVILLFTYFKWLRKAKETAKLLPNFYKALAIVSFLPIVSPSYWISLNPLFWNVIQQFLPPAHGGAGIAMWLVSFVFLSVVFCLLCIFATFQLSSGFGKALGLFVSLVFVLSNLFSLPSLYNDLLQAFGDPYYYWLSYVLYILANLSVAVANVGSVYFLLFSKRFKTDG